MKILLKKVLQLNGKKITYIKLRFAEELITQLSTYGVQSFCFGSSHK